MMISLFQIYCRHGGGLGAGGGEGRGVGGGGDMNTYILRTKDTQDLDGKGMAVFKC
jgi:hypothetical protein